MELQFKRRERVVGVFVVLTVMLLLSTVVVIGRGKDWFKTYIPYYTVFKESYNLSQHAEVKIAKTKIGKVKKITLSETEDEVRVDFVILEEYAKKIRVDTVATVESPTFIGSEYVSITFGDRNADPLPQGSMIKAQPKKSFDDIMAEFEVEKTAKKFIRAVQDMSDIAAELKAPEGPLFSTMNNLDRSMAHIEEVLRGVQDGEGTLGELIRSEDLLKKIYLNLDTVQSILLDLSNLTSKGDDYDRRVKRTMDTVQKILENVEAASYDVPKVTESTKRGIGELRNGLRDVDKVVQSIKRNPLIRSNIPEEPEGVSTDASLRP